MVVGSDSTQNSKRCETRIQDFHLTGFCLVESKSHDFHPHVCASYIRKEKYRLATTPAAAAAAAAAPSRSGDPPWILKRGGLESSGQRLIS